MRHRRHQQRLLHQAGVRIIKQASRNSSPRLRLGSRIENRWYPSLSLSYTIVTMVLYVRKIELKLCTLKAEKVY